MRGPVLMNFSNRMQQCAWPRPVGTRGGCGEGWGPCACPGGNAIRPGSVRHEGRTATRTSTRPPHPPNPSPCPYRRERLPPHYCIRLANIIRDKGWMWGRVGALCLSWWQCDSSGFREAAWSYPTPTRTSTRPPHPPHSAPCPYSGEETFRTPTEYGWQKLSGGGTHIMKLCSHIEKVHYHAEHAE